MRLTTTAALLVVLAACSSGPVHNEAGIRPEPKRRLALSGIVPLIKSIPAERNGIRADDTGAIMFICANTPKHEDKEVYIDVCTKCYQQSTFFWNAPNKGFVCFKCSYLFDREKIVCDECGEEPRRTVRIKPKR